VETEAEGIGAVVSFSLFGLDADLVMEGEEGGLVHVVGEGFGDGGGAEAGFELRDAEEVVLGDGDALDGKELLGVGGLVDIDEVGAKAVDGVAVFEFEDSEGDAGEAVLAGVLGGFRFAFGGTGAGGFAGVGAVGGELFVGRHGS
jgi:hypothetical protein